MPIIIEDEFDPQTGVLIGETRQTRHDATYCEAGGGGDAQEAAQLTGPASGVIGLFEGRQDGLNTRQIVGACLGKRHGSSGSNEERDADLLFEGRDDPRRRRLRNAHLAPSDRKIPAPRDAGKQLQRKEPVVHSEFEFNKVIFSDYCELLNNSIFVRTRAERPHANETSEHQPCRSLTTRLSSRPTRLADFSSETAW